MPFDGHVHPLDMPGSLDPTDADNDQRPTELAEMRRDLDAALARIDTLERHLFKTDAMRAHYGLPPHPEADEF